MKELRFHCNGCRKTREIVKRSCGMSYCEDCKDKAPTPKEFKEFVHKNSVGTFGKRISSGRPRKELFYGQN